jgi:hypothetical protein
MTPNRIVRPAFLASVLLTAAAASAPSSKPAPDNVDRPRPQGFSVVLVLGDSKAAAAMDDSVPPAARKALADLKDFLPYKGYRLLDVQWILGSDRGSTRLRGVDEQEYVLTLRSWPYKAAQSISVTFQLQDASAGIADTAITYYSDDGQRRAQLAAMQDRRRQLELEAAAMKGRTADDPKTKATDDQKALAENQRMLNSQLAELRRQIEAAENGLAISRGRNVIDTSFNMDIGETVVVGTSRVRGGASDNRALIALLTAVPKSGTRKQED